MFKNIDKNLDKAVEVMEEYDTYLSHNLSIIEYNNKYTVIEAFHNICIFPTTDKFNLMDISQQAKKQRPLIEVYLDGSSKAEMYFWGTSTNIEHKYWWDGILAYGIRFPRMNKFNLANKDKVEDRIIKEVI